MALFTTTEALTSLINAGADAMSNLFYIRFHADLPDSNKILDTGLTIRSGGFTPPSFTQPTHSVHYMTTSADLPSTAVEGSKQFDITFRTDANYDLYKWLKKQQSVTSIGNLAYASNDVPGYPGRGLMITVYAMDEPLTDTNQVDPDRMEDTFKKMWEFKYCWVAHISEPSYTYGSSDPITVTATFRFWDFTDPMNLLLKEEK